MKPGGSFCLSPLSVAAVSVLSWRLGYRTAVAESIETPKADTLIIRTPSQSSILFPYSLPSSTLSLSPIPTS